VSTSQPCGSSAHARQPVRAFEVVAKPALEAAPAGVEALERELDEARARHRADVAVERRRRLLQDQQLRHPRVRQPSGETGVEILRRASAREDRGQRRVEAMRHQLQELLASPGRLGECVEVVEDHQGRVAQLLQQALVRQLRVVAIRSAQLVEQVGHREEERRCAALDGAGRDRGREVGLAAAGYPRQHEPASGWSAKRSAVATACS
jgi:hypothetical protein